MVNSNSEILVTCAVLSYNSADTLLDTLESIKAQTYSYLELIISDDCSKDNTIELCHNWIAQNGNRFVNTEVISVENNTGVADNCNRAVKASRGEWLKLIAADDKLLPNCISDYMQYVTANPNILWASSRIRKYNKTFDESNCVGRNLVPYQPFFDMSAEEQLKILAKWNVLYAPSIFYNTAFVREIGFDPKYIHEDLPFYVNALERGHKCYFMDKETVCYRIHQSISQTNTKLFNYNVLIRFRQFREERLFKYLTRRQRRGQLIAWKVQDVFERLGLNKNKPINTFLYKKINAVIYKVFS